MKEDFDKAIEDYTTAIKMNPKDGLVYNYRGICKVYSGRIREGLWDLNKSLSLDSFNPEAYCYRGYTKNLLFMNKKALADVAKSIRLEPNAAMPYFVKAVAHYHLGEYDEAEENLIKSQELER